MTKETSPSAINKRQQIDSPRVTSPQVKRSKQRVESPTKINSPVKTPVLQQVVS